MAHDIDIEKIKLFYLRNRLWYRNEILYGEVWRHASDQQLKIRI